MSNLSINPLVNLSLPLAAQQAQILEMITTRIPLDAQRIPGEALTLQSDDPRGFAGAPVAAELEALEDRLVGHLSGVLPPEASPRLLLFGPGSSKTDPLYALRFLAKLSMKTDRTGEVAAYDAFDNPQIRRYYTDLPWGSHQFRLELGKGSNFERLRGPKAHMILAVHPGCDLNALLESFSENLVRGGIGLFQASVLEDFSEGENYSLFLKMIMQPFGGRLELLQPPIRARLFRSYFSERSDDVHVLAIVKK